MIEKSSIHITVAFLPTEIKSARKVREEVFQKEQGIDRESDFDNVDGDATHIVAFSVGKGPIGAARIRFPESRREAKIERVAVLTTYRGQGIGERIMQFINDYLKRKGVETAYLDSQERVKGFYERLGYIQEGNVFEEVGIPHVKMVKRFK